MTGPGGTQVDAFTATVTVPSSFTVTNWSSLSLVNRTQPLTVNWTGSGFDQILIYIQGPPVALSCTVPASSGTYTIPTAALAYLPATSSGQISVTAGLAATSFLGTSLTPGLVAGGQADFGTWAPFLATIQTATIQ
jgi:hypothetical protein